MFNDKSLLITGGTGSFGQKFTKYILENYKPKRLIVFSRDELKQYYMEKEFSEYKKNIRFFIGDIRDKSRLLLALRNVDFVVHAAAMKQVPIAEYNPMECIKTNILGAQNLIEACIENKVKKIIALSTDKAANPINLYGATKLASDKLFVAANNLVGSQDTLFSVVRYGNVLGSRGSVIPLFKDMIEKGVKELPITDFNMTRFWVTLEQAIKFVEKNFERMLGGEIFIPKIPSMKIVDLVKTIAPNSKMKEIGLRPGEKLHEILCPKDDGHLTLEFKDHYVIKPSIIFTKSVNYEKNNLKEKGAPVIKDFEYRSDNNSEWITGHQLNKLIQKS